MDNMKLREELFNVLKENGAALAGVGDLTDLVCDRRTIGVSVAVPVPAHIVEDLKTAPTKEYYEMYRILNNRLNRIVEAGEEFLCRHGYDAHANTTGRTTLDENWCSALPHKTVATRAGLGWIGKSCLLVTKEYGSAVRISSLVTDAPLPVSEPVTESQCGACTKCVKSCPGQALTGALWKAGMPREELFRKEICKKAQTERMEAATGICTDLCGLCFAVCPYTQRYFQKTLIKN